MILVYFFYGLAFFILGLSILIYPKKNSAFPLAKSLSLIGIFGIIHGIYEWIILYNYLVNSPESITVYFNYIKLISLSISFYFLVLFGIKGVIDINNKLSSLKVLPIILFITWILFTIASGWDFKMANIWARYFIGVPGIFLTSFVIFLQASTLKIINPQVVMNIKLAACAFFFYGIFAGLIVPEAQVFPASLINDTIFTNKIGIPVEAFRTACAVVLSYNVIKMLNIFNLEVTDKLRELSLKD